MGNARLDEVQAGIRIAGKNINNLRYADNSTLMAESQEDLKSLLMKEIEESEKTGLKLNIQKINMIHFIENVRKFQKNIYFCCTDYAKASDCVDYNKLWKSHKRDRNTRPPDLPPEKSVCRSRSNS